MSPFWLISLWIQARIRYCAFRRKSDSLLNSACLRAYSLPGYEWFFHLSIFVGGVPPIPLCGMGGVWKKSREKQKELLPVVVLLEHRLRLDHVAPSGGETGLRCPGFEPLSTRLFGVRLQT